MRVQHGERRMLTINYCGHLIVFLGFALAGNVWLLYAFYLGYNFLFTFFGNHAQDNSWDNATVRGLLRQALQSRPVQACPGKGRCSRSSIQTRGLWRAPLL